jgi:DNA-directed RNA polymerase subunit RPC12/RpoP
MTVDHMRAKLNCSKCSGRVFLDRAYSNYGHVELFCLRCGKRWEAHKDSPVAKILNKIERKRELGHFGNNITELFFPEWKAA